MLQMHANKREEIKESAPATSPRRRPEGHHHRRHAVRPRTSRSCSSDEFPEPVISSPSSRRPRPTRRRWASRCKLAQEDPSFRVRTDEESGQTIISGMGELHLEIIVDRMKREFKVEANVGKPQVAYRETIRKPVESRRQVQEADRRPGQYGHVVLKIEPQRAGQGLRVRRQDQVGGSVPREYIPAVEKGIVRRRCPTACSPATRWSTSR
jgi:elongation factor G